MIVIAIKLIYQSLLFINNNLSCTVLPNVCNVKELAYHIVHRKIKIFYLTLTNL